MASPEEQTVNYTKVALELKSRFASRNKRHPQHQGVSEEEIASMLSDGSTVCTEVEVEGSELVALPQLARVQHFEWLNSEFYQKRFPENFSQDTLLNLIDIPGVDPGKEVIERIRLLASKGGVLAFETSSCDPDRLEQIEHILRSSGIVFEEPQLLGTQTYFAGQTTLLSKEPSDAPLSLGQAYDKLGEESIGLYDPDTRTGVVLQHNVPEDVALYMYDFYTKAYEVINDHPCRQGLSPEEFLDMAVNDSEIDKLIYFNQGVPEALYLACNDLSKLSWVNLQHYREKYPEEFAKRQLVWFPGIATDPRPEVAGHNTERMVALMAKLVDESRNNFVALMDFCDLNAGWLPGYLESEINKTTVASISIPPIATQHYWAVNLQAAA